MTCCKNMTHPCFEQTHILDPKDVSEATARIPVFVQVKEATKSYSVLVE